VGRKEPREVNWIPHTMVDGKTWGENKRFLLETKLPIAAATVEQSLSWMYSLT